APGLQVLLGIVLVDALAPDRVRRTEREVVLEPDPVHLRDVADLLRGQRAARLGDPGDVDAGRMIGWRGLGRAAYGDHRQGWAQRRHMPTHAHSLRMPGWPASGCHPIG